METQSQATVNTEVSMMAKEEIMGVGGPEAWKKAGGLKLKHGVEASTIGVKIDVPYGNPYTPEKQTEITKQKVTAGLKDVMNLLRDGCEACVDKQAVVEHASKLERQAEKILEAIGKDAVFIEEVRHHHNRISDLCDNTRDYTQEQMVSDLKRAASIRMNVMTIVQGKKPEYEIEQDELDDLKTIRNMLRGGFGGRKAAKKQATLNLGEIQDQTMMLDDPSKIKVNQTAASMSGLVEENAFEAAMRANTPNVGNWAAEITESVAKSKQKRY